MWLSIFDQCGFDQVSHGSEVKTKRPWLHLSFQCDLCYQKARSESRSDVHTCNFNATSVSRQLLKGCLVEEEPLCSRYKSLCHCAVMHCCSEAV